MTPEHMRVGATPGSDIEQRISRGQVIPQAESCQDNQVPEVVWAQYGIPATGEVVVVACCGALSYYAVASSYLLVPSMADRIFGLDVADEQLGHELADQLWGRHGAELIAEAQRLKRSDS